MKRFPLLLFCVLAAECGGFKVQAAATPPPELALKEAEEIALKQHPRISAAALQALASKAAVKQVRAALFPSLFANVTSVGAANDNTRIAAGGLNNPAIFDRNAEGVVLSQLITDFGRTANLTSSSIARARAEQENAEATREQVLLAVNAAYYSALEAQAVSMVARKTVEARRLVLEQVQTLATNKIKSELDVSFARVNVSDAQLLQAKATNDLNAALANLSTVLGYREQRLFQVLDEPMPPALTNTVVELTATALRQRPDLLQLRYQRDSAAQFAKAEKKLGWPTVSAVGSAGIIPIRDPRFDDNYAAAGVNVAIPLFTGGLYAGRRSEAAYHAQAAEQNLRDQENNVIRDVRVAQLNVEYTLQRLDLTAQLLANTRQSLDLAQARINVGSSSIVELSQAQLNETAAEIAHTNAKYDYLLQRAALNYQIGALR